MTDLRKAVENLMPILERWKMTYPPCSGEDWDKVEALRQALAEPEQEPVAFIDNEGKGNLSWRKTTTKDIPLYAAPPHYWGNVTSAELVEELRRRDMLMVPVKEQEPEWIDDDFGTMWQKCGKKDCGKFVVRIGKVDCWNGDCPEKEPKREWVGLTDEEIGVWPVWSPEIDEFVRTIEAKLKEKNT